MDADDLDLFRRTVEHALATGADLAGVGWHDALADDEHAAVSVLFEAQGRSCSTSGALAAVLAVALGVAADAVVLGPLGSASPPGTPAGPAGIVEVRGLALGRPAGTVAVASAGGVVVLPAGALGFREVGGLDPALGLVEVTGTVEGEAVTADWTVAVAAGQRALAHELVGVSRTMLELARVHALERVQFDRPIAGFQAVRHRLAESLVAIEGAAAALDGAWDEGTPLAAAVAKAVAGRSARLVAKHCQQVCAGIGFTTEHPLHRSVRRALVLDRLLGDSKSLTRAMGEQLLSARRVPPLLPL